MREEDDTYFAFSASLRIFGDIPNLEEITSLLGVEPTYRHQKGYRRSPRSQPMPHDMWIFEVPVEEDRELSDHLDALWAVVKPKLNELKKLKDSYTVDIFCGYRSNSGTAGFEVRHQSLEIFRALEAPLNVSVIIT